MEPIRIALWGVGGYAANYLRAMAQPEREGVQLVGAVDPFCKACALCPVYDSAEELFAHCQPELAVIATPIHCHAGQAVTAFQHGCHVMLEKPIAPDLASVRRILDARDQAGRLLNIGFNLCANPVVRAVRADAQAGVFGKPLRLKTIVLWPRDHAYYHRGSGWAGKKHTCSGEPIYDSVLSNATAHYLMNILYMLGEPLVQLACQTYRANSIETYDTALLRGYTASGAEVFAAVSHAVAPDKVQNPIFHYEYENATLTFGGIGLRGDHFHAHCKDGTVKDYGSVGENHLEPFWNMMDVLRGQDELACPGETAMLHVDTIEKMRMLQPEATPFPDSWKTQRDGYTFVPGLAEELFRCYEQHELPRWNMAAERLARL
ncbi:MAG: Gfo/Idh/MocA family protein [Aristaeellaceae bacterium]